MTVLILFDDSMLNKAARQPLVFRSIISLFETLSKRLKK